MNTPSSICSLLLALIAIAFAPTALAQKCGDVSPLLSELGDQYYELENIPKSELRKYSIKPNNLIDSVQSSSFKVGQGKRTRCFGTSVLREEVREFVLESIATATVNGFNEVVLKAYEYEAKTRTAHSETVFIPLSRTNISLTGENGFVVNKRHRQGISSIARDTHLQEISITATGSKRGIEINQSIYLNGHLVEWFTWRLNS
jgi:hypothetical protein